MKKLSLQLLVHVAIFLLFAQPAFSQTTVENLEKGVEAYNALREYCDGFTAKTLTDENLTTIKNRMDNGVALLNKVINEGNSDQIKAGRYFKVNFKYEYGFMLGMKGRNFEAYDVFKEIDKDITAYASSDFPIRYSFFGKNFIVNWDNFSSTQAEYLTGMSEICFNLSKYEDAVKMCKLAINHPNTSDWLKYVAINKMLDIHAKNSSFLSATEQADYAFESLKAYDKLDEKSKETVKEYNYPTVLRGTDVLLSRSSLDKSVGFVQKCADAAVIAAKYEKGQANALKLLEFCYLSDIEELTEFHWVAVNLAKVNQTTDRARSNYVGNAALDKIVAKLGALECEPMARIADEYRQFNNTAKANVLGDRYRKCQANALAEKQRQEEQRRKQEELDRKRQHRYEHPFNIYLGVNVIPLMAKPENMDFGGHVDLRGRRVAHSFGYSLMNNKSDWHSDNQKWDGTRAFYALKVFGKSLSDQMAYSGFYFAYAEKEFMPRLGTVHSKTDPNDIFQASLAPKDKQYDLAFNGGIQTLGKGIGMDIWYGIGVSYYQLSYDNLDLDQYTITDDEFFEARDKKESYAIYIRLGISFGLNLGRKRV